MKKTELPIIKLIAKFKHFDPEFNYFHVNSCPVCKTYYKFGQKKDNCVDCPLNKHPEFKGNRFASTPCTETDTYSNAQRVYLQFLSGKAPLHQLEEVFNKYATFLGYYLK